MALRKPKAGSFEDRWLRRQRECSQDDLGPPDFLKCGDSVLPNHAAPFVSFEEAENRPRIWEVYSPNSSWYWSATRKKRLSLYRVIGSDGCGNPICLHDKTGVVWMLDHEDHFRTRQFVNSSVALLAECLLARMGEQQSTRLLAAIKKLDRPAAAKGTFWDEAAANLASVKDEE